MAIDNLIGLYTELPDRGKAELQNLTSPPAPSSENSQPVIPLGNKPHELPPPPISQEPMNVQNLDERIVVKNLREKSKYTIFVSTNLSRHSWTSVGTSFEIPSVKTTISSDNINIIDMDRSLPPTPISESLQCSPAAENFSQHVLAGRASDALTKRRSIIRSTHGDLIQIPPPTRLNAWQRALAHLSYSSMDMEIVIPPGSSDVDIVKPLNVPKQNLWSRRNFF